MQKQPIFIIGCPRSGTTLVRVILDSHQNICSGPEAHLIEKLKSFNEKVNKNWKNLEPYKLTKEEYLKNLGNVFSSFQESYTKSKDKKRWAEKTPDNIFYVDFINQLFPDCQFINIIRDGRDVVCSFKERWGRKSILNAMKNWNKSIELSFEYKKKFSKDRYLEVRYEKLVNSPEIETKKIIDFLKEDWTPDLLKHHNKKHDFSFNVKTGKNVDFKTEKKPLRHSPSKPIFQTSAGKWERNLNVFEKAIVNFYLKENLRKLGYK